MQNKKEVWVSDNSNKKVKTIKQSFTSALNEQSKDSRINYYDFLLVAKKLSFRFEESSHLMALKNFFSKNKNSVLIKKLTDSLSLNQEGLNSKDDKIIVKFNVPDNDFAPIKEVTNEDEEQYYESDEQINQLSQKFQKVGSNMSVDSSDHEIQQKMTIILSIKVEEMQKKIKLLTNQFHYPNIFTIFDHHPQDDVTYENLKSGILNILMDLKEKVKMSEDDIKTLFYVLDENEKGYITIKEIQKLKSAQFINEKMKEFYQSRINKQMVKNTLFKLGKVKNSSIQIYQLKNASVLQFQQIQQSIVNQHHHQQPIKNLPKKKIPHFGPLKGANKWKKNEKYYNSSDTKFSYSTPSSNQNLSRKGHQIDKQRERIEKILRSSKEEKKKQKKGETVASKLRSLFIHKVILPRQKMLEEQKEKYMKNKGHENQLSIRPLKETF